MTTIEPTTDNHVENLQEYSDSRGIALRVDPTVGVLTGVKLIGLSSRNGRQYRELALSQAVSLYEEARVNVNHPKEGPLAPRDYQDRIGIIRGVEFRAGEGLFGNLHFNPRHALAEQLVWDAEHNPRNVGFSHNVQARVTRTDGGLVVEEITRVQSVDLVADPATTEGLFEQQEADSEGTPAKFQWDALTLETLRLHRPDLLAEIEEPTVAEARTLHEQLAARIALLEQRLDVATGPRSRDQLALVESGRMKEANPKDFARSLKTNQN
ncbi:hypothetical protein [Bythopirellula polymerisocia]|uniref:Uncharacterized protein n=1 Tax=Bythopirellula polymerisocia TaxID=2528003 RepID=A0A5C6D4S6_9BACT|nr:hypothetical protein [Bythopirellula polymerisocia]TWU30206.1 hypothetical protein Pla144_09920 [Bythopirellula polymerisocia]